VPVGAIITLNNKIIARGFNKCIILSDPTAHAEIVALRKVAKKTEKINNEIVVPKCDVKPFNMMGFGVMPIAA
jgi:tRNA(Arg) A34 adenosine deaminase TadA